MWWPILLNNLGGPTNSWLWLFFPSWCHQQCTPLSLLSLWSVCCFFFTSISVFVILFFIYLLHVQPPFLHNFVFLISFSQCSSSSLSASSTFFALSSSVFLLFLYGMIEAKLGNELGFQCALVSHSCHLLLCWETKIYMNKVWECVSTFYWWTQEVLWIVVCSLHRDPLRVS